MKTIRELKDEGLISTRLYRALIRGITFDDKFKVVNKKREGMSIIPCQLEAYPSS